MKMKTTFSDLRRSAAVSGRFASSMLPVPFSGLRPLAMALAVSAVLPSMCGAQTTTDSADSQPVVITASRNPQAPRDVLSDNIVITSEEILQSGQTNLVDLLQQKRGIEIATNGGPGSTSTVSIRGASNAESIVLIDGVRIGSSTAGGATWENIPLSQIDHIEIVYGPLSSMYGADAMGGVVQIFTKQGDGAFHQSASVGYGSYNTRKVDASIAGASTGDTKIHYALQVARDESDGFPATTPAAFGYKPEDDGYDKESVGGQLSIDLAAGHVLGLNFLQSRNQAQYDNGLNDAGQNYDDHVIERLNTFSVYSRNQFTSSWKSILQISQSQDKEWTTNGPDWLEFGELQTNTFNTTQKNVSWQNDITFGSDILQVIAERRIEDVYSDSVGLTGGRDTNSLAASYQLKRGNQLAVFSIRNDDSNQYGSQTTGGVAYGYHITNTVRVNASYGTSFRAPTFNELYFQNYGVPINRPEKGKNAETGIYYDDGNSHLSAVYYYNKITDMLVYDAVCPIPNYISPPFNQIYSFGCAYNVDHAVLSGLTLGGKTRIGNFSIYGSLDFQDPRDETTGTILARRAKQHGTAGVDYQAGNYSIGVDSVFSGKRYDDQANQVELAGYGLLNLHANIDLNKDWSLFARWNNVFNRDYELAYGYTTPGSNVFVGVRYGFR